MATKTEYVRSAGWVAKNVNSGTVLHLSTLDGWTVEQVVGEIQQHREQTVQELLAEIERQREHLQFVERWVNHHGQKPNTTPREVLSMIQHYPPIVEITRSYADGRVPETPNPWAEIERLRARLNRIAEAETVGQARGIAIAATLNLDTALSGAQAEQPAKQEQTEVVAWLFTVRNGHRAETFAAIDWSPTIDDERVLVSKLPLYASPAQPDPTAFETWVQQLEEVAQSVDYIVQEWITSGREPAYGQWLELQSLARAALEAKLGERP